MIQQAKFTGSFPRVHKCPDTKEPEFAFIGRSNVGKSSLINMLTGRKDLAKISNVPGKTMLINFYLINESWFLVDLPGYGYAKRSKKTRAKFSDMMEAYLLQRPTLACAFILVDGSIAPQKMDLEFINWMGENGIPFGIIITKTDKKNKSGKDNVELLKQSLLEFWDELPPMFLTSALQATGREELTAYLEEIVTAINS